jgi:hypothetical protein
MCLLASLGAASLVALSAMAQTPAPATTTISTPAQTDAAPAKLPYGAEDILKLSRAQVSDDVTVNFIKNSGTIYNLTPKDIVYLRNEGVSDHVINTMLDQRSSVPAGMATQTAPPSAPQAPAYPDANAAAAAQASAQYAPTYAQPAPVYAQPEPAYAPASSVYVMPYSSPGYGYSGYYPYYGGYYPYYGPSVVFGFGYRGGGYYGGYHGGYYGGGYRGSGYGGGGHGGHR